MSIKDYVKEGRKAAINSKDLSIFYDNGADILAVAHLDVVGSTKVLFDKDYSSVFAMQLDDRLGVWCIMDYLKSIGCPKFDILLTVDEEKCRSTAKAWVPPEGKKYRYMFQLDRNGTDSVIYNYDSRKWISAIEPYLGYIDRGSYSDICELERLGCSGVNVGVGYYKQHTESCYAVLSETLSQCQKLKKMLWMLKGEFPHVADDYRSPFSYSYNLTCEKCETECDENWNYCPECGSELRFSNIY